MRKSSFIFGVVAACLAAPVFAAAPTAPVVSAPAVVSPKYTTADTEIGTLLDDPAAKAILDKIIPGMTSNDQIEMARSMTLKSIQQYAPDQITDQHLAQLDAELAKLPSEQAQ